MINKHDWINIVRDDGIIFNTIQWDGTEVPKNGYSFELWEPKMGEWCWFWNIHMKEPVLCNFIKKTDSYYESISLLVEQKYWKYSEPFIGKLPTNIKEKQ